VRAAAALGPHWEHRSCKGRPHQGRDPGMESPSAFELFRVRLRLPLAPSSAAPDRRITKLLLLTAFPKSDPEGSKTQSVPHMCKRPASVPHPWLGWRPPARCRLARRSDAARVPARHHQIPPGVNASAEAAEGWMPGSWLVNSCLTWPGCGRKGVWWGLSPAYPRALTARSPPPAWQQTCPRVRAATTAGVSAIAYLRRSSLPAFTSCMPWGAFLISLHARHRAILV
jgi:hypothetical protein